jgi:hypothetical protein
MHCPFLARPRHPAAGRLSKETQGILGNRHQAELDWAEGFLYGCDWAAISDIRECRPPAAHGEAPR